MSGYQWSAAKGKWKAAAKGRGRDAAEITRLPIEVVKATTSPATIMAFINKCWRRKETLDMPSISSIMYKALKFKMRLPQDIISFIAELVECIPLHEEIKAVHVVLPLNALQHLGNSWEVHK